MSAEAVSVPAAPRQIRCKDRKEWLAARRPLVTGSEAPIILGVAPWGSPMELYTEKLGLAIERPQSERMLWGQKLQRVVAEEYSERTGRGLVDLGEFTITISPRRPWMGATLDYLVTDKERGRGVLQVKTAFSAGEWDEGEPPVYQEVQLQHEIECADVAWGSLAVLVAGNRLLWADLDRNGRFLSVLVEKEEAFLERLRSQTPPPVDGREATAKALCALYSRDDGGAVALPPEAVMVSTQLVELEASREALDEEIDTRKNWLRAQIGEASMGLLPDGTGWSWKWQDRAAYQVAAGRTRPLRRVKNGRK